MQTLTEYQLELKLAVLTCVSIAVFLVYWYVSGRKYARKVFIYGIILAVVLKIAVCITVYSISDDPADFCSDVSTFYYPHTLKLLAGETPYKDFDTRYSILFLPLLAIPVLIWNSMGSIVLTMILMEALMIFFYLRYQRRVEYDIGLRTAFFYSLSPISLYWMSIGGYNSVIIAAFIMFALILADKRKDVLAGAAAALAFLFSKFLAFLTWPAIVLFRSEGIFKRTLPMAVSIILTLGLLLFDIDSLNPIKKEFGQYAGGNIWYLSVILFPALKNNQIFTVLPVILFLASFIIIFFKYIKRYKFVINRFDVSAAFISLIFLLFMLCSRKTYNHYSLMIFIFIVHTIIKRNPKDLLGLLIITYLGAITFYEVKLSEMFKYAKVITFDMIRIYPLIVMDVLLIASYIVLFVKCYRAVKEG
ncbi:MAG: hypothetical protein H8E87_04345 [FCB group bacterium]|nr:hypothetical protein [FCB group bacterium]